MAGNESAPLAGLRVLDLTRLLPGPLCTMHLADLGADVIKIEDTGQGDYARSELRWAINRNKRGLCLDLKRDGGRGVFLRLAAQADVVVEGFRPGVMTKLGAGYDAVHTVNPKIVYCSISGYGQTGVRSGLAGHDINYCALTGVADQTGSLDGALALSGTPFADLLGGTQIAVSAMLAALYSVSRGGEGRHIDVSMADGAMTHAVVALAALNGSGKTVPVGQDRLNGSTPGYGFYKTADSRELAIGALEPKFWEEFCAVIGREDLKSQQNSTLARLRAIRAEIEALMVSRPLSYWEEKFSASDRCVSPVSTPAKAMNDLHFAERGIVAKVECRDGRSRHMLGSPYII